MHRVRPSVAVLITALAFCSSSLLLAQSQPPSEKSGAPASDNEKPRSPAQDTVLHRLSKVERFAFGLIGFGAHISTGEKDYKAVLARSTALADFEKLFAEGNIQAKCYALVGIHKLNPTRFNELVRTLAESKETVTLMHGCLIDHAPVSEVLKLIAAGIYDDRQFHVGDKVRVNLHHGKIEDAVIRAVIQDGYETKLQVDVVGLDLTALVEMWQVVCC